MDLIRLLISRQQLIDITEECISKSGIAEEYAERLRNVARTATQLARGSMFHKLEDGTRVSCPLNAAGLYIPSDRRCGIEEWLPENGQSFFTYFDILTGRPKRADILEVIDS